MRAERAEMRAIMQNILAVDSTKPSEEQIRRARTAIRHVRVALEALTVFPGEILGERYLNEARAFDDASLATLIELEGK